jgi:hypothetical protein
MAMKRTVWGLAAFFFILTAGILVAEESVVVKGPPIETTTRLIYATNNKPELTEPELAELIRTFKKDFGYLNYEVKKTQKATLKFDETATQDLGDDLIFIFRNLGTYKEQRKIWLELWFRGKKVFGAFSLSPKPAKPVLIKGPNTNEGAYIIMLSLVGEEAK